MIVHTFHGRTAAEALARARRRLGADACVLETRRTAVGIEVLAAAERPAPAGAAPPPADEPVRALYESLRERLIADGFAPALSARIAAAAAARTAPGEDPTPALREGLARWLRVDDDEQDSGPRAVLLVGAPGAGKTTTAAKLAAREAMARGGRVVLASMDDQRLGGLEQLAATARALDVPFVPLGDPGDAVRAQRLAGRHGLLLVDTPGVSRKDTALVGRIDGLAASLAGRQVELVVAADADELAITDTVHRFRRLSPRCIAVTRLDEAGRAGNVISVLARTGLPVRHVATGPVVPDDLARATVRGLARWALPAVPPWALPTDSSPVAGPSPVALKEHR